MSKPNDGAMADLRSAVHGNGSPNDPETMVITIRVSADGRMAIDHPRNLAIAFWLLELAQDAVKAKATQPSVIR